MIPQSLLEGLSKPGIWNGRESNRGVSEMGNYEPQSTKKIRRLLAGHKFRGSSIPSGSFQVSLEEEYPRGLRGEFYEDLDEASLEGLTEDEVKEKWIRKLKPRRYSKEEALRYLERLLEERE